MGKKSSDGGGGRGNGTSWLTRMKRAFSPKDKDKRNGRSRQQDESVHEDEERKREKRRWLFRKSSGGTGGQVTQQTQEAKGTVEICASANPTLANDQRHAFAMAAASAAAAEAAVATAQAAMEIARFTRPSSFVGENSAAVVIQTAFRGYLARRALRALKGLVKLQALVRGHNVRKQAKLTLQCMQAMVRFQDRMRDQRARLSHEGSRKSMFESSNLWESSYLQDIRERKSMSRNTSCAGDIWDDPTLRHVDIEALLQSRIEVASQCDRSLAHAFSQQIWRSRRNPSIGDEKELDDNMNWPDRWMPKRQWDSESRASTDRKDSIKTVEVDTSRPYSYSAPRTSNARRSIYQNYHYKQQQTPHSGASPLHRAHQNMAAHHSPSTPSPSKTRPIHVRSASPRCYGDERCYSAANTPSLASAQWLNSGMHRGGMGANGATSAPMPNYMAATESAKAKARSQSAPRQRPSTPERDRSSGSAKKRLSYPVPEPHYGIGNGYGSSSFSQNLRSPSFKSVHNGHYGLENRSNLSCYTESIAGGEISPCSTTDLRWFR